MNDAADGRPSLGEALDTLNDEQRQAVDYDDGPLVVLAGPGTGKTRVIVHRVARLVAPAAEGGTDVEPESVLALAFTVKAAQQLRDRLAELVGPSQAARVRALTCHAFGAELVRRFGDMIGLAPGHRLMDSAQRRRLMRVVLRDDPFFQTRAAAGLDAAVNEALGFADRCASDAITTAMLGDWCDIEAAELDAPKTDCDAEKLQARRQRLGRMQQLTGALDRYEQLRLDRGLVTFDDFVNLPIRILRQSDYARVIVRDEVRHIVVDEFQDLSPSQIELLSLLAPPGDDPTKPDLCVVGDDDQSINAFRGADDRAFERFAKSWPAHHIVALQINYRSAPIIVDAANAIIRRVGSRFKPDKTILPDAGRASGEPSSIEGVTLANDSGIGCAVAAMILVDRMETDRPWRRYAVIARNNIDLDRIAIELEVQDIPAERARSRSPLDDDAVRDLLAWMRLLTDPNDAPSTQRLLIRPPFGADPEKVRQLIRARGRAPDAPPFIEFLRTESLPDEPARSLVELYDELRDFAAVRSAHESVSRIVHRAGLTHVEALSPRDASARITALAAVLRFVADKQPRLDPPGDLASFFNYYNDLDDNEQQFDTAGEERLDAETPEDERPDAVALLTVHKAKGLEFDTVFVVRVRQAGNYGFPTTRLASDDFPELIDIARRQPIDHLDEERRLFYVACTRAQRRLVLVARALKRQAKAGDYFDELTMLQTSFEAPVIKADYWLAKAGLLQPSELDSAGATSDSIRRRWIRREIARARQDAATALHRADRAGLSTDAIEDIARQLGLAAQRLAALAHLRDTGRAPERLTMPGAPEELRGLVERFEKGERVESILHAMRPPLKLSYTKIVDYEKCPRCFYAKYVLGLDEPKTPMLAVGDIVHRALERFFNETSHADAEGLGPLDLDRLFAIAGAMSDRPMSGDPAGDADAIAQIEGLLRNALMKLHDPSSHILEIEYKVRFPWTIEGVRHNFTAKIDRLDRLGDDAFRLIDYKTGRARKDLTEPKKNDLQLCIYAMALRELFGLPRDEPPPGVAEYWALSTGERGVIALADLDLARATLKINSAAEGMLTGKFNRKENGCRGLCDLLPRE